MLHEFGVCIFCHCTEIESALRFLSIFAHNLFILQELKSSNKNERFPCSFKSNSTLFIPLFINPYKSIMIMFPTIVCCSTLELAHINFSWRNLLLNLKQQKKRIGHRTRFRENDDLPLWRSPAVNKKSLSLNARALITREANAQQGCAMQY